MSARGQASRGAPTTRDRIEQGIAREYDDERIAREVGCTVERVRKVRIEMNRAAARYSK